MKPFTEELVKAVLDENAETLMKIADQLEQEVLKIVALLPEEKWDCATGALIHLRRMRGSFASGSHLLASGLWRDE